MRLRRALDIENRISDEPNLIGAGVVFQAHLNPWMDAHHNRVTLPRALYIEVDKPVAKCDLPIDLSRTEKGAFARSPRSRWDLAWGLLGEGTLGK